MNILIAAIDRRRGIAKNGKMPWKIPDDEAYFTEQTKTRGGNVLVASTTFKTFKGPLVDRHNYVLTHHTEPIPGVELVHDLAGFLSSFKDDLWIIGGSTLFEQAMQLGKADELYLTHIDADFNCDRFFPPYEDQYELVEKTPAHQQNGLNFYYAIYRRKA